jgi:hypothetical protein
VTITAEALSIERLSPAALLELLAPQPAPCLSIYLPTHRNVPGNTVDLPAFRQLIEAVELALEPAHAPAQIERLLHPLRFLAGDRDFWAHAREGLAVLAAAGAARVFLLQRPVPHLALVGDRFHTMPLVRIVSGLDRFEVLALTSRQARAFEGTAWSDARGTAVERLDPVPIGTGPDGEILRGEVVDEEIFQPHRVQRGMGIEGIVHGGTGAKRDDVDADTEIFLRHVDEMAHDRLSRRSGLPLVVVAQSRLAATFRGLTKNPLVLEEFVPSDPHLMTADAIAAALRPLVVAARARAVAKAVAAFSQARDRGLAQGDLSDVARAAVAGKVATLLIEADRFEAGRFDRATGAIAFGSPPAGPPARSGDVPAVASEDLFGAVAETVLLHGGTILALARNEMPTESGVAAIYRYA